MRNATKNKPKAKKLVVKKPALFKPLSFQKANIKDHVEFFRKGGTTQRNGRKINCHFEGSDKGAGKTYISAFVAKELGLKLFVICPKPAIAVWQRAAEEVGVSVHTITNYEKLMRLTTPWVDAPERRRILEDYAARMVTYEEECLQKGDKAFELLKPKKPVIEDNSVVCHFPEGVLVVVDEAHRCKGLDSLNAELLIGVANASDTPSILATATGSTGPHELRALGYAIGLHELADFTQWARCHGCIESQWGKLDYWGGTEGLQELHAEIFPTRGCRIRIADLPAGMFPETQIAAEAYDMGNETDKIRKVYDDMEAELIRHAEGVSGSRNPLVAILRARQKVELLKVPTLVEMIKDDLAEGYRVAAFVNFKETMFAMQDRLKTNCLYYGGNVRDRGVWLSKFQANQKEARVMLLNIAAGAEAISLHDEDGAYPRVAYISPTWSAFKLDQATGRVHRAGGKSASIQRIVYAANTIEQQVCIRVREKMNNMVALNDGDMMPEHLEAFLRPICAPDKAEPSFQKQMKTLGMSYESLLAKLVESDDEEK